MQPELLATHEMTIATCHVTLFTCRMGDLGDFFVGSFESARDIDDYFASFAMVL
jgi:hypothetical protein